MIRCKLIYFLLVVEFVSLAACTSKALGSSIRLFLKLRNPLERHPAIAQVGNNLLKEKDYEWALQFYNRAINDNPVPEASYYHGRGTTFLRLNDTHSAVADFKMATSAVEKAGKGERLDFDDAQLVRLATQLIESGKTEDAYWCYTEAIKRNPSEPSYRRLRGNLHFLNKDWSRTLSDYRDAVARAIESGHGETSILEEAELVRLGDELVKDNKRLSGALWCYDQAIKRNPFEAFNYRLRGVCNLGLGNISDAISDFREEVRRTNDLNSWYVLIRTMFDAEMYAEALEEIRTFSDAEIVDLAVPFFYFQKYEYAIRLYTEALGRNADNVEAYEKRGRCHLGLKRFHDAHADFREVLDRLPNHKAIKNLLTETLAEAKGHYGAKKGLAVLLE